MRSRDNITIASLPQRIDTIQISRLGFGIGYPTFVLYRFCLPATAHPVRQIRPISGTYPFLDLITFPGCPLSELYLVYTHIISMVPAWYQYYSWPLLYSVCGSEYKYSTV